MVPSRSRQACWRQLSLLAVLCSLAAGCGGERARAEPLGAFVLDAVAMRAALAAQGVPEAAAKQQAAAGRVRLSFDPAGSFLLVVRDMRGGVERWSGRWSRTGPEITLRTEVRGQKRLDPAQVVRMRLEGATLRARAVDSAVLPFVLRRE